MLNACNALQPDGVQRGLVGTIISRFEQRGFKIAALKLVHATPEHLEKRMSRLCCISVTIFDQTCSDYADLKGKPFFPGLIKYMASGPVVGIVFEGLDAVKTGRSILGATNPLASAPGEVPQYHIAYLRALNTCTLVQAPSVVTLPSLSAATSPMAPTLWRTRRRRSLCMSISVMHEIRC